MAELVLQRLAHEVGVGDAIEVDSAGTGDWHIGERADRRAVSVLAAAGYDGTLHRARQFDPHWFSQRELVIGMDGDHLRTLRSWASNEPERARIHLLRSFDPAMAGREVSELELTDPYYDTEETFAEVLGHVEAACRGMLAVVLRALDAPAASSPSRVFTLPAVEERIGQMIVSGGSAEAAT
jgi:protein-tyrosine phosphatase